MLVELNKSQFQARLKRILDGWNVNLVLLVIRR